MKSVLILYNDTKINAAQMAYKAETILNEAGVHIEIMTSQDFTDTCLTDDETQRITDRFDAILSFGGDGTLLGVARQIAKHPKPLMGINMGGFGFLTTSAAHEMEEALECIVSGKYTIIKRYMLEAWVMRTENGEQYQAFRSLAFNEALVTLSRPGRLLEVWLGEEGESQIAYRADGLIVATPTGSTGHSLSAGGPILEPHLPALVITPVSPHSLFNRPLVFDGEKELYVTFRENTHELLLILDGQIQFPLTPTDQVRIRRSTHRIPMINMPKRSFSQILRLKFNLGQSGR